MLEAAREGETPSAEEATGYYWGEKRLHPHVRRIVDCYLHRINERQTFGIARRQSERIDRDALAIRCAEHGVQLCARIWFDGGDGRLVGLRIDGSVSILLAQVCVQAVGQRDDGFAPLAFPCELRERIFQSFVEMCLAFAFVCEFDRMMAR